MSLLVNKGSDLNFKIRWPEGTGQKDLSLYIVQLYDYSKGLPDTLSLTITNPTQGEITGRLDWNESIQLGRNMFFRVKISSGEEQLTTNRIWIEVV